MVRKFFTLVFVLIGLGTNMTAAWSQEASVCKLCREDYRACKQAHSEAACRTNYDICMKHCRKE